MHLQMVKTDTPHTAALRRIPVYVITYGRIEAIEGTCNYRPCRCANRLEVWNCDHDYKSLMIFISASICDH